MVKVDRETDYLTLRGKKAGSREQPRYTLDELLAQCDPKVRRTKEEQEWLEDKPAGRELI
jgi:antitoxin ChpS